MTGVSLERLADTLYPKPEPKNSTAYGTVESINPDGSYQVKLNASATTTRCAKLCDAEVTDRVLVLIQSNGHCAAIGRVGGSVPKQTVELLWTNPNPSSSFTNQELPFDGTYDAYAITSIGSTSFGATVTAMLPKGISTTVYAPASGSSAGYRYVTTAASSVSFTGGSSTSQCIPYFIWGVRY